MRLLQRDLRGTGHVEISTRTVVRSITLASLQRQVADIVCWMNQALDDEAVMSELNSAMSEALESVLQLH